MQFESLRIVRQTSASVAAAAPGLCIVRAFAPLADRDISGLRSAMAAAAKHPEGFATLFIIGQHAPPPKGDHRTAVIDVLAEHRKDLRLFTGAVEGDDLNASVKRTILRVLLSLGRVRCPSSVHKSVEAALEWMAARISSGPDVEALQGFCAEALYPNVPPQS